MISIEPLCLIQTPFKDKFGIPRQSGLIPEATGELVFPNENFYKEALRGVEEFSHLWLTFLFDKAVGEGSKSLVRPPRLGGREKKGVWATRSPHRPNHLGLTVVRLLEIRESQDKIILKVGGVDLLDQTPILDIKPYVSYADSIEHSTSGWVLKPESIVKMNVVWGDGLKSSLPEEHVILIEKILEQDPRPPAQKEDKESYVFHLFDYEIWFKNGKSDFLVSSIKKLN